MANGATADHWEVALCPESQRGRHSDKVQVTFCGAELHADTWFRLPRDVHTIGQSVNIEDSACVRCETGHQVPANGHKDSIPQCTHRRKDFSGAEGFKQGNGDMVCKLKKSLYGLNQSERNWYVCLAHRMQQLQFHSSQHDKCLWTQKRGHRHCRALVWVDDID